MTNPEINLLTKPNQEQLMRVDLQQTLTHSHIEPSNLSTFQRILLTTDGTVTDILEAYLLEQIQVVKLSEAIIEIPDDVPAINLTKGARVISRKVLLRGKISRKNFIYAESIIVLERLDKKFRDELLKTKTPIGKLWFEQRVETFKEIVDSGKETAKALAGHFSISTNEDILYRSYSVYTNKKPVMLITEKFPANFFIGKV